MPSTLRLLTGIAVAYLVAGIAVAFTLRDDTGAVLAVPVGLALLGAALVAVVLVLLVRRESRLDDLAVPEDSAAQLAVRPDLAAPSWWGPAAAAAASVAVTGAYVSPLLAGVGLGVLAACLVLGTAERRRLLRVERARRRAGTDVGAAPLDRETVRLARRILDFGRERAVPGEDGGEPDSGVDGVLEHLGRYGTKVVLVGADGRVGDLVVRDSKRAELACTLAGVRLAETFDRELSARMRNTRYEWQRMGATDPGPVTPRRELGENVQTREADADADADADAGPETGADAGDARPSTRAGG